MNIKFWALSAAAIALIGLPSTAQDSDYEIETLDEQEQELSALPKVTGPLTIIRPASLVFAGFDQNGDYVISKTESDAGIAQAFKRADKDRNLKLSLFELEDWRLAALGSHDALPGNLSFDTDYDNQVGVSEFKTTMSDLFDRHDTDEDKVLKFAELVQVLEVPRSKEPSVIKDRLTDRECADQLRRSQGRF